MGPRLSATVPVARLRHRPYQAYYTAMGRWRRRRSDQLQSTVLIAGSPRSGTTWLGDVVSGLTGWPLLHEPTHARKVTELRDGHSWDGRPYRAPEEPDDDLAIDLERLLTGTYLGAGIVPRSWSYDRLMWARTPMVTKAIDINLLLPWLAHELPWLRTIHLVRHPLEVIASQEARTGSVWSQQRRLPNPYRRFADAHPEYEAPHHFDTVAECLLTTWCIEHAWLRDRGGDLEGVLQVRYEDMRGDLHLEATRVAAFLDLPEPSAEATVALARPSRAVNPNSNTFGGGSDGGWRARYGLEELQVLDAILDRFGHPLYPSVLDEGTERSRPSR
jgi:hypothetical protein